LANVQIIEHPDANGIELKFHYSIRSKNDAIQNKKLVFSSIVENVTEMDMRMFIKTRKERLGSRRQQSKCSSKDFESDNSVDRRNTLSGSSMLDVQTEPLPSEVL